MDSLSLLSSWDNSLSEMSSVKAQLNGIYVQGARMTSQIEECDERSPSWNATPSCLVSWIPNEMVKIVSVDKDKIFIQKEDYYLIFACFYLKNRRIENHCKL